MLLLASGASEDAQSKYGWSSDAENLLDTNGDGEGDEEGYYIY